MRRDRERPAAPHAPQGAQLRDAQGALGQRLARPVRGPLERGGREPAVARRRGPARRAEPAEGGAQLRRLHPGLPGQVVRCGGPQPGVVQQPGEGLLRRTEGGRVAERHTAPRHQAVHQRRRGRRRQAARGPRGGHRHPAPAGRCGAHRLACPGDGVGREGATAQDHARPRPEGGRVQAGGARLPQAQRVPVGGGPVGEGPQAGGALRPARAPRRVGVD
ncbi:MAG TPA: hypothetical protein PKD59_02935, partial [Miltoncostaeaceae bacterium]|nr:hypothetical protein [Miltoncostaeaceae bacterium]